jgi:DNA invertase Pin-like site-specific DNA recombinase
LRELCERRGWNIGGTFTDIGVSGGQERRPQLDQLLADCRKRLYDVVVVYRYDRFARSVRHLVNALAEFDSLGIQFVSVHEGVDTSTPNGRLVFGIFATIAEFERELIRDVSVQAWPQRVHEANALVGQGERSPSRESPKCRPRVVPGARSAAS